MKKRPSISFKNKHVSLSFLLVLLAVGISIISILICGTQFHDVTQQFLTKHYSELNSKRFAQASDYISDAFAKVDVLASMVSEDQDLLQIVSDYSSSQDALQTDLLQSQIIKTLAFVSQALPDIQAVSVSTNINTLTSLSHFSSASMTQDMLLTIFGWEKGMPTLYFPGDTIPGNANVNRFISHHSQYILYAFPLIHQEKVCATVIFTLYPTFLLGEDDESNAVALLRSNGHLMHNSTGFTASELSDLVSAPDSTVLFTHFPEYELFFVFQPDMPVLDRYVSRLTTTYCIIGVILIVIAIFLSDLMIRPILRPLRLLKESLENIQEPFPSSVPKLPRFFSKGHIFLFLTVITLTITVSFSLFSYSYFRGTAFEMLTSSVDASFRQAEKKVDGMISNFEYTSVHLAYNEDVQTYLLELAERTDEEGVQMPPSVDSFLKSGTFLFDLPTNFHIYSPNGTPIYSATVLPPAPGNTAALNSGRRAEYSTVPFWSGSSLLISRKLINTRTMQTTGFLSLQTDEYYVSETFDFFPSSEGQIYLLDQRGSVLSSNDKSSIGKAVPTASDSDRVFSRSFQDTGLTLVLHYSTSALSHEFNVSIRNLLYQLLVLLCLLFLINFSLSHYLSVQFRRLTTSLYNFSLNSEGEQFYGSSLVREINQVYAAFNNMSSRIQTLVSDILAAENYRHQLELEKKQSDLLLLQSQINPHFLYNTFEAINGLIVSGKQDSAITTLNSLADMLRFSTKNNLLRIPVQEEIEYINRYINIMHLRYPEQLSLTLNISEAAMEQQTVKFILQPILENAIYHGFKPKGGCGHISVTGTVFDGKLLFVIRDDGVGMHSEKCRALQAAIDGNAGSSSIGLPNVANRLRLLHGAAASLTVNSTEGYGTVVTVIQPACPANSDPNPPHPGIPGG